MIIDCPSAVFPHCIVGLYFLFEAVLTRRRFRGIAANGAAAWRQRRLPLPLLRAINVQFRTTFSAGLLPPLRQTARWLLCILSVFQPLTNPDFALNSDYCLMQTKE